MADYKAAELVEVLRSQPYLDLPDLAMAALPYLAAAMGHKAHGAVLHWIHPETLLEAATAEPHDFHTAMHRNFMTYQQHNHEQPLLRYCLAHPQATPVTLSQCAPDRAGWEETALYQDYFRPLGVRDQLAVVTTFGGGSFSGISISGVERGCFTSRDESLLLAVKEEFAIAVERAEHRTYQRLADDFEALLRTSEQVAVIAVDRLGLVRMCSGPLCDAVDEALGPVTRGAPLPEALDVIRRHLSSTPSTARRPYAVAAKSGEAAFMVLWFDSDAGGEGILRVDLAHTYDNRWSRLQPDEMRLMGLWASGRTAEAISVDLRISVKTVHNKINKIYSKLDVPNQRAAIREFYGRRLRVADA